MIQAIARHLDDGDPQRTNERAIGLFSLLVGSLQAARAVTDPELSDRILAAAYSNAMTLATAPHQPARPTRQETRMKAFVVTHYGPDGLEPADVPTPTVGPHDVLVDIRAASINPLDKMVRNGEFKQLIKYQRPFILGHDLVRRDHQGRGRRPRLQGR